MNNTLTPIFGLHVVTPIQDALTFVERVKPSVLKIVDSFSIAADYQRVSPNTIIVGRTTEAPTLDFRALLERGADPFTVADNYYRTYLHRHITHPANQAISAWEDHNEPVLEIKNPDGTVDLEKSLALMAFCAKFSIGTTRKIKAQGKIPVVGAFSVGTPDLPENDRFAYWRAFDPALRELASLGGWLNLHQYINTDPEWDKWYSLRHQWPRQYCIEQGIPVQFFFGETGKEKFDNDGTKPWRKNYSGTLEEMARAYVRDLMAWYAKIQSDPTVVGAALFTVGGVNWDDYDVIGSLVLKLLADALLAYGGSTPPPTQTLEQIIWANSIREQQQHGLALNPQAALQKRIKADNYWPVHNELGIDYNGKHFAYTGAEHPTQGARRVYIWAAQTGSISVITDPNTSPPTIPPPEPPPGGQWDRLWPIGKCLVGLHGRGDGRMQEQDFNTINVARIEAVKLLSTAAPEDSARLIREGRWVMVRTFAAMDGRGYVHPDAYASWVVDDMRRHYDQGVRYFEIHNEPNLKIEGQWQTWQTGMGFAEWWVAVRNNLAHSFPEAKFGWPGLSPGSDIGGVRYSESRFLDEASLSQAFTVADFVSLHCYWQNETEMRAQPGWPDYRQRFPNKLLFVTEFSNPSAAVTASAKGDQYNAYYLMARKVPGLGAVFSFLASASSGFQYEVWRGEGAGPNEIAVKVGQRGW